jgi:hypothetical protein
MSGQSAPSFKSRVEHATWDASLAGAFVARWCIGYKVETAEGALKVREDEPARRVEAGLHSTLKPAFSG